MRQSDIPWLRIEIESDLSVWEGLSGILVSWVKHLVKRGTWLPVNFVNAKQRLQTIDILAPPEVFEKR